MANNFNTGDTVVETSSTADNTWADGVDLTVGSTTGTKLATATTQKLGFYNATPVVQPAGTVDVLASLVTLGLRAASSNPPLNLGSGAITSGAVTNSAGYYGGGAVAADGAAGVRIKGTDANGFSKFVMHNSVDNQQFQWAINDSGVLTLYNVTDGGAVITVSGFGVTINNGDLTVSTKNIVTDTTTGTKIGTATTQKIGFFNATPIVQPARPTDAASIITTGTALGLWA